MLMWLWLLCFSSFSTILQIGEAHGDSSAFEVFLEAVAHFLMMFCGSAAIGIVSALCSAFISFVSCVCIVFGCRGYFEPFQLMYMY